MTKPTQTFCSKLARKWRQVVRAWESVQVELHGRYSVERMYRLKHYSDHTSVLHAFLVLLLTPIPCLAAVTLLDCIPLEDPRTGLQNSHMFWLRAFLMVCFTNLTVLEQLRRFVPAFPITIAQILFVSIFVASGAVVSVFGLSLAIGYPVPFAIALGSPATCSLFVLCFAIGWGKFLQQDSDVRGELLNYAVIVSTQVALTYVYPAFTYVFINLSSSSQTVFALMLPILKLFAKNWVAYVVRHMEDFKPEVVIFNVELFHALYVACCMQGSTSTSTTVLLMAMDFVQAMASLHDVNSLLKSIVRMRTRIESTRASSSVSRREARSAPVAAGPEARDGVEAEGDAPRSIPLLEIVQYLVESDERVRRHGTIRLEAANKQASIRAAIYPGDHEKVSAEHAASKLGSVHRQKIPPSTDIRRFPDRKIHSTSTQSCNVSSTSLPPRHAWMQTSTRVGASTVRAKLSDEDRRSVEALDASERLQYVQRMLQLLHLTEFVLLIEFTEVIIPIVYCE